MQKSNDFRTSSCVLGIDPGLDGGMTVTCGRHLYEARKIPTWERIVSRSRRRYFDTTMFSHTIKVWKSLFDIRYAAVENVHASPQMGVASAFSFGHVAGCIAGALASAGIGAFFIEPSSWKNKMGLTTDKKQSLAMAGEIFLTPFKHDGIAEAALIGYFHQLQMELKNEGPLS